MAGRVSLPRRLVPVSWCCFRQLCLACSARRHLGRLCTGAAPTGTGGHRTRMGVWSRRLWRWWKPAQRCCCCQWVATMLSGLAVAVAVPVPVPLVLVRVRVRVLVPAVTWLPRWECQEKTRGAGSLERVCGICAAWQEPVPSPPPPPPPVGVVNTMPVPVVPTVCRLLPSPLVTHATHALTLALTLTLTLTLTHVTASRRAPATGHSSPLCALPVACCAWPQPYQPQRLPAITAACRSPWMPQ